MTFEKGFPFTDKKTKPQTTISLEHGKPLLFDNGTKGIALDGLKPKVVDVAEGDDHDGLWIHDETDMMKATILTRFFDDPSQDGALPRPFGVFYCTERSTHEEKLISQVERALELKGEGDLDALLEGENTWVVN